MLGRDACDLIFRKARSYNGWLPRPVSDEQLKEIYELVRWGPTSANCQPMRIVFVRTPEGMARLKPALAPNNVDKTLTAPVVAIVAYDTRFYEHLPQLFPRNPKAAERFATDSTLAAVNAFRNGSMQGGYFIIAARSVGLDCAPMSGFDNTRLDAEFFPDGRFKSNFICAIGYGDPDKVNVRNPRFEFDEVCTLL
jgi:3-hydroxypropanoate dehydrogenase